MKSLARLFTDRVRALEGYEVWNRVRQVEWNKYFKPTKHKHEEKYHVFKGAFYYDARELYTKVDSPLQSQVQIHIRTSFSLQINVKNLNMCSIGYYSHDVQLRWMIPKIAYFQFHEKLISSFVQLTLLTVVNSR